MKPLWRSPTGGPTLGPVPGSEFHNDRVNHLHGGIDLNCRCGHPIIAPRNGRIIQVGCSTGLGGNKVEIDHGLHDNHRHITKHYHFGHKYQPWQECIWVHTGDRVQTGQALGVAGDSGNATAVHDHYEHYVDGRAVDPLQYLREYQVLKVRRLALAYPKAEGPDIPFMQQRLTAHGFYCAQDGVYGPLTEVQVKRFQTARGLTPDGIVGRMTWRALVRRVML